MKCKVWIDRSCDSFSEKYAKEYEGDTYEDIARDFIEAKWDDDQHNKYDGIYITMRDGDKYIRFVGRPVRNFEVRFLGEEPAK